MSATSARGGDPRRTIMRLTLPVITAGVLLAGCAPTSLTPRGIAYRVTTGGCQCELFMVRDPSQPVRYEFAAAYEIDEEFVTRIILTFHDEGKASLTFTDAYARVASRNIPYQYNNRFVPLATDSVLPRSSRTVTLVGRAVLKTPDPWLAVAGEELTVTIRGIKYGARTLAEQSVTFVPRNPKLAD